MTTLKVETIMLPAATLGPENPLPRFREPGDRSEPPPGPSTAGDPRRRIPVLPYRLQDNFDLERRPHAFKAIVLENEFLTATFLPELGGRLVSLVAKPSNRELLARNPVIQPANLGLRGAWFSGGIEWNAGHNGHHHLTCSPVFAAEIPGLRKSPALRLYEWDRVKGFPWQIDFHLPPSSKFLFVRACVVNPYERELPMHWWTNIAVPDARDVRVLTPADSAAIAGASATLALAECSDIPFAVHFQNAHEFDFHIPAERRPWIAALDHYGRGLVEVSTSRLRGRKAFFWGVSSGGRRWQEFLNGPGTPCLEIQAGLVRPHGESVAMPPLAVWTWTEALGLLEADPERLHSDEWETALGAVEQVLETWLPRELFEVLDTKLGEAVGSTPGKILATGSGWGALERRRLAHARAPDRIPPELVFDDSTLGDAQAPWLALLENGEMPEAKPADTPPSWMVQEEWRALLEAAVQAGKGDHWLSWLHLGIMRLEAGDTAGARAAWERSLEKAESGWALRNLAVLEQREGRPEAARDLLRRAWDAGPGIVELAVEYAQALQRLGEYDTLRAFLAGLPEEMRQRESLVILAAQAAVQAGDLEAVEPVFHRSFATVREGETALSDLWFEYQARRVAAGKEVPVDDALRQRVRQEFPPPRTIDFRLGG